MKASKTLILFITLFFCTLAQASYFNDLGGLVSIYQNPTNPFMAAQNNNMHVDSYVTDVHPTSGPIGFGGIVSSFHYGALAGECAGILFDRNGDIMTVCVRMVKTELLLIDKSTLEVKASYRLPGRPNILLATATLQFEKLMEDTSGGAYFVIDNQNRAVIATAEREILIIGQREKDHKITFELEKKIELKNAVPQTHCPTIKNPNFSDNRCDKVTTVLIDFNGNYWFISRYGKVGVVNRQTEEIKVYQLPDKEELQNSFAVGKDGVFIVSSHALYHFNYKPDRGPYILWREGYNRGTERKLGQVNQGSGTSPSLMGDKYVAISDNASPRMNVLVYRRGALAPGQRRLKCALPVFKDGESATENSFVVFNNSLIVENNFGYKGPFAHNQSTGGVARIDIDESSDSCHQVWESNIIAPTCVAKLSQGNGVLYFYTKDRNASPSEENWSLTGLDFETGKIITQINTGRGNKFNNNWGAISIGPDQAAYVGSLKGFIKIESENLLK